METFFTIVIGFSIIWTVLTFPLILASFLNFLRSEQIIKKYLKDIEKN